MSTTKYDRRAFMAYFSSIGLGSTLFPGVLWGQIQGQQQQQGPEITKEMIASAEQITGLSFSDEERTAMVRNLTQMRGNIQQLHKEPLDMSMLPAIVFDPVPPGKELPKKTKAPMVRAKVPVMSRPGSLDELARRHPSGAQIGGRPAQQAGGGGGGRRRHGVVLLSRAAPSRSAARTRRATPRCR